MLNHRLLNHKQQIFVAEYARTGNATRSAKAAGYSPRTARSQGQRLLTNVDIRERLAAVVRAAEVEATDVLREQAAIAFATMADFVEIDKEGRIEVKLADVPRKAMDAVAEIKQEDHNGTRKTRIRLHPKLQALDQLAKHLGLYKQDAGGEGGNAAGQQTDLLSQALERLDDGELAAIQKALEDPELEPLHKILVPMLMEAKVPGSAGTLAT